jgi:hypothetical protein
MIKLHPLPDVAHKICPACGGALNVIGWYMPGMRPLADLRCESCQRAYYGDIPVGQSMYSPILLDQATGEVRGDDANDMHGAEWYAEWLRESYANRVETAPGFTVEEFGPIRKPLLLNCIDTLYGHTLSKLINAQYYVDHMPDWDLIVLIPHYLRWLVPDGVTAIWTVKLPLKQGTQWNDGLARILAERITELGEVAPEGEVWISKGYSHAHPEDFDIERFSRIKRFPMDEWDARLDSPLITFVWREDRLWVPTQPAETVRDVLKLLWQRLTTAGKRPDQRAMQGDAIVEMGEHLRGDFPMLRVAVVGLATPGGLPAWIDDQRTTSITDEVEHTWCEMYAQSHIVFGLHGSNMLLPSAHAGSVIEFVQPGRWANIVQDLLPQSDDVRDAIFRYRHIPSRSTPRDAARCASLLLRRYTMQNRSMSREGTRHTVPTSEALQ